MKYFKWRSQGWARAPWNNSGYRVGMCRLCELLSTHSATNKLTPIPDVGSWFLRECACDRGEFVGQWLAKG